MFQAIGTNVYPALLPFCVLSTTKAEFNFGMDEEPEIITAGAKLPLLHVHRICCQFPWPCQVG